MIPTTIPTTATLVLYSAQILVVIGAAAMASALLPLPPRGHLAYWRGIVVLCLALGLVPAGVSTDPLGTGALVGTFTSSFAAVRENPASPLGLTFPLLLVAGVLGRMSWLAVGLWRLQRLRRDSAPAPVDAGLAALRRRLAPQAAFRSHGAVAQPVTFGWRRPVILLPRRLSELPDQARHAVVCHELLHVARGDWAWLLIEEATRTIFWFHPAMWWAIHQVQLGREQVVDDLVVQTTSARREYMDALVTLASPSAVRTGVPFIHHRQLAARIAHLARRRRLSRAGLALRSAALLLVTLLACAGTVSALPLPRQQSPDRTVYTAGDAVQLPKVLREVRPGYTPKAMEQRIEGTVLLECVVPTDGVPIDVAVVRSLDEELDDAAAVALGQWRFQPGTKDGAPVSVRVSVEITFTLK